MFETNPIVFSQPVSQIIKQRFSCRTYAERVLEGETLQKLEAAAAACHVGPLGTRSRFKLVAAQDGDSSALRGLGTYGFIRNAPAFLVGASSQAGKALEDFGYLMEKFILYATDLGLGTCWLGGSFSRSRFAKTISLEKGEVIPAVTSVGFIHNDPSKIDQIVRKQAYASVRFSWETLFYENDFDAPMDRQEDDPWIQPLEMVRLGPSASNKQPWRIVRTAGDSFHFYLKRTPGYKDNMLSRLLRIEDLQRVDLGIAMSHFALTATEIGLPGTWQIQNPEIALPVGHTEYVVSWAPERSQEGNE